MTVTHDTGMVMVPEPVIHLQHYYSVSNPEDKTIASLSLVPRHDTLFLVNLWVDGTQRHKHLGTALLNRAVRDYGGQDLHLHVASYTDRAFSDANLIAWYGRFGFEPTAFPGALSRIADKF